MESSSIPQSSERANLAQAHLHGSSLEGANLSEANLEKAVLKLAKLHATDLSLANLTEADFRWAEIGEDVNLTDAIVTGAILSPLSNGLQLWEEQIYPTASYKAKNLERIGLPESDLEFFDFAGQNLAAADFSYTSSCAVLTYLGPTLGTRIYRMFTLI